MKALELYPKATSELGKSTARKRISKPHYFLGCDLVDERDHREARRRFACALRYWPAKWEYQVRYLATFFMSSQLSVIKKFFNEFCRANGSVPTRKAREQASNYSPSDVDP
jgi:hypothetical protein